MIRQAQIYHDNIYCPVTYPCRNSTTVLLWTAFADSYICQAPYTFPVIHVTVVSTAAHIFMFADRCDCMFCCFELKWKFNNRSTFLHTYWCMPHAGEGWFAVWSVSYLIRKKGSVKHEHSCITFLSETELLGSPYSCPFLIVIIARKPVLTSRLSEQQSKT